MYKASIRITLRPSILDPQGKAIQHALESLSFDSVDHVRMGKLAEVWIDEPTEEAARAVAAQACEKLLANPVMEDFEVTLERVEPSPA